MMMATYEVVNAPGVPSDIKWVSSTIGVLAPVSIAGVLVSLIMTIGEQNRGEFNHRAICAQVTADDDGEGSSQNGRTARRLDGYVTDLLTAKGACPYWPEYGPIKIESFLLDDFIPDTRNLARMEDLGLKDVPLIHATEDELADGGHKTFTTERKEIKWELNPGNLAQIARFVWIAGHSFRMLRFNRQK
ncbi:hypothetical protein CSKR_101771 [Clonorchis sinensis]|uniref:Uncharacterized protein n=2 Tax=Clonorchis sinensis TaxID=79923 RepID=G7Y3H8_CLOSI|nr:hypothetical protein CSKR_101771 [Clonorchis sinensis]GAA47515.1 hypothetical protein CLF_100458 [Clonorchis sinensis]